MEKSKYYKILRALTDFTLYKTRRNEVRRWLIDPKEADEKEKALYSIWMETPVEDDQHTNYALTRTWKRIESEDIKASRRIFMKRIFRYAAIIILPLVSGLMVWEYAERQENTADMIECYVPHGEQQSVVLPDGSSIRLNAGSLLIYPSRFTSTKRMVYLSGEGYFHVEGDKNKPFIVRAGSLNIEVLGTKFNIESYPGSGFITTTLEQGAVKIYKEKDSKGAIFMKPNQQLTYFPDKDEFVTDNVNASDYSAWTNGELRFINKSLDDILFTLERKYDIRFLPDRDICGTDLFTMKFKAHETIEDALYVLSEIIGTIDYTREGQTIRLTLKRKAVTR